MEPALRAGLPGRGFNAGPEAQEGRGVRDHHQLHARPGGIHRDAGSLVRHAEPPFPGVGVSEQGTQDQPAGRARGRPGGQLPVRGRYPGLRRAYKRIERPSPQDDLLPRARGRGGRGRGCTTVELRLSGFGLHLRQQHQYPRGRGAPLRLPGGIDAHDQRLCAQ